ncbi:hypothetical protein J3R30DRAFT_3693304 [Lentinula aciculospora]|uniref:Uncharacterized protein n=1 Tax=Lentinula aciculospora TaxID=153920 RepID=A0A9W9AVG1_9AGAR|nr:hypothetical protein J3R30DRAFT_3693304 [Lentinula aciculospora]
MVSLPEEIEYEIFKLATCEAQKVGSGLLNSTLVAHRVNNWVRSFVLRFSIVAPFQPDKTFLKALQLLPPSCLQQNVASLCILSGTFESDAQLALERCTNTESLAYWTATPAPQTRSLIQALPLRRLSVGVKLFSELCKESHLNRFVHSLRELALIVGPEKDNDTEVPNFSAFPNLTRFVVSAVAYNPLTLTLVNTILDTVQCRAVILYGDFSSDIFDQATFIADHRFGFYHNLDGSFRKWEALEKTNWEGFWTHVEQ